MEENKGYLIFGFIGLVIVGLFLFSFLKFKNIKQIVKESPTPTSAAPSVTPFPTLIPREVVKASSLYAKAQVGNDLYKLLANFSWPKLKPFTKEDATREVYLVDCEVTNDNLGFKLIGIPTQVPNVANIAEVALKKFLSDHLSQFPSPSEISKYEKLSGKKFKNSDIGINSLALKNGVLTINFYDSVAAYGGGSARVGCLNYATNLTMKQFPTIKEVKMCIDKTSNCEMDFQP